MQEGILKDKTKLDEEASIYQKRVDKTFKERMAELKGFAKVEFFVTYYLGKILVIIGIAAFVIYLGYTILRPRPEVVMYVAVVNSPIEQAGFEGMKSGLAEYLVQDAEKQEIIFDTSYYMYDAQSNYESRLAFMTHLSVGEIDTIIAGKSELTNLVNAATCMPLKNVLSADITDKLADRLIRLTPNPEDPDEGVVYTEDIYGIDVTDYMREKLGAELMQENYYLAFVVNSEYSEQFVAMVKYMFSDELGLPEPIVYPEEE